VLELAALHAELNGKLALAIRVSWYDAMRLRASSDSPSSLKSVSFARRDLPSDSAGIAVSETDGARPVGSAFARRLCTDMVPLVAENVYKVWLLRDGAVVSDGFHIYRGEQLPEPDQIITVEVTLSPVPTTGPTETKSARVTRLEPGDQYPIHAAELEPEL